VATGYKDQTKSLESHRQAAKFYREILGMKVLRHEEFEEGCKATCNGPYDGKWSKSTVGYGSEDNHCGGGTDL
jgi:catechol 2,3-dioxygenase-like lactoylglutathione lyase family enzyme